ncbi:MAG: sugar isomerase domain-containing protein [Actinobacteria bacterium]|uniref:Unannotated protein n=1 Tax=freshwater metagenome TaxID=449393 RepID=A0A6J6LMA1_9ZZZZ|nr:SIS domain-containing protein [Actinomycetota bacterium]MSW47038.1 sugar isomerase domain-containing protein [Actinomycetota bacterium]MSX25077.1 sugar isomerase domain-containing protein [Actinomycetota bacterium]MSY46333.1 sugar isomerase domain-containing protein [Actinomycetota bacterium]MSY56910.1 sugar isomerase domain-containing protein [Actinomycetota bacterium]
MIENGADALQAFTSRVLALLLAQSQSQNSEILKAAKALATTIENDGLIHTFGTGHSHLLAEEIFYRAGGLANVSLFVNDDLMLHKAVVSATAKEREPGVVDSLLKLHPLDKGDCLIVISNSGGNGASLELAQRAKKLGITVIALTSVNHATSGSARSKNSLKLHEIVDIVLDNGGVPGDAFMNIEGIPTPVGATSTIVGAYLLESLVVQTIAMLASKGKVPDLFLSSNLEGGDMHNAKLFAKYLSRIEILN